MTMETKMEEMMIPMLRQSLQRAKNMLKEYDSFQEVISEQYAENHDLSDEQMKEICVQAKRDAQQAMMQFSANETQDGDAGDDSPSLGEDSLDIDQLLDKGEDGEDSEFDQLLMELQDLSKQYIDWIEVTIEDLEEDEESEESEESQEDAETEE